MKKLKQNLGFDCTERFKALEKVCDKLGFTEEADIYRKLMADCEASGV